jgi:hypothetical protein
MASFKRCVLAAPAVALTVLLAASSSAYAVNTPSANKTTASFAGSVGSPGPMTGTISLSGGSPSTAYTIVDAFQALPEGDGGGPNRFYTGTYTIALNCTTGTGTGSTETIAGGGVYPGGPPPTNSGAPTITTDTSGNATCSYTIGFSGNAPSGRTVSIRNDIWVLFNGTFLTQTAGPSVTPPFTGIPEAPFAVLLPISGFLVLGMVGLFAYRRRHHGLGMEKASS